MLRAHSVNSHTIQFLIPDRDKFNNPIDTEAVSELLITEIVRLFGGLRKRKEQSVWVDPQGKMFYENVIVLESSFNVRKLPNLVGLVATFTLLGVGVLNQAELAIEIDGQLVLIPTDPDFEASVMPIEHHTLQQNDHQISIAKRNGS